MKKFFAILALVTIAFSVNAQNTPRYGSVANGFWLEDGILFHEDLGGAGKIIYIKSTYFVARDFTDQVVWSFNAELFMTKTDVDTMRFDFIVGVVLNNGGSEIPIDRDGVMLIKLMNDSIIELPCFSVNVKQTDTKVSSYSIGNTTYISNSDIYRNEATYLINYKDIQKLKIGVKKIRVQTISGFVEKEYSKDKCGANLFNSFVRVINESQKAPWNRKEKIYENF